MLTGAGCSGNDGLACISVLEDTRCLNLVQLLSGERIGTTDNNKDKPKAVNSDNLMSEDLRLLLATLLALCQTLILSCTTTHD